MTDDRLTEGEQRTANGLVYAAVKHFTKVLAEGKSEYIEENGRFGCSPWAELLGAVDIRQRLFFPERYALADQARRQQMEAALRSIAANSCCAPCREAGRVAQAALDKAGVQ